jgi:ureidoacrylate peracid hydrolase
MVAIAYEKQITALLVVDRDNDFISEGGKIGSRIQGLAEANNWMANMLPIPNTARDAGLMVFCAMHNRRRPGDYETC